MKKQWIVAIVVVLALLCAVAIGLYARKQQAPDAALPRGTAREYRLSDVAQHNSQNDCFIIYSGQVYDITNIFSLKDEVQQTEIAKLCGTSVDTLPTAITDAKVIAKYQIGIAVP